MSSFISSALHEELSVARYPTDRLTTHFANAALACFAVFALGVVLMHVLRPDIDVSSHRISDYAEGPWGGLMTAAFAGASLGCLMLALGFARSCSGSVAGWLCAAMFAVASVGLAATALFPTDMPGASITTSGDIHRISFFVNVSCIVLAALLTAVVALRDERWREHRVLAALLALLLVVAVAVQFRALYQGIANGIANRFVIGTMMIWLVVTAVRLRRLGGSSQ